MTKYISAHLTRSVVIINKLCILGEMHFVALYLICLLIGKLLEEWLRTRFRSQLCHFRAVQSWMCYLTSLGLRCVHCYMGMLIAITYHAG